MPQALNVGESRAVRLLYFLPNNRQFRAEVVQKMKEEIQRIQRFYTQQMQAHGYGNNTFQFESNAQGEAIVHRVDGERPDHSYLPGDQKIVEEIERRFDIRKKHLLDRPGHQHGRAGRPDSRNWPTSGKERRLCLSS